MNKDAYGKVDKTKKKQQTELDSGMYINNLLQIQMYNIELSYFVM